MALEEVGVGYYEWEDTPDGKQTAIGLTAVASYGFTTEGALDHYAFAATVQQGRSV